MPIPLLCRDGFNEAYYGRPEMLLDPGARRANSAWSFVPEDGSWDCIHGHLRTQPAYEGSLRLLVSRR